jgi:hypothetical protein
MAEALSGLESLRTPKDLPLSANFLPCAGSHIRRRIKPTLIITLGACLSNRESDFVQGMSKHFRPWKIIKLSNGAEPLTRIAAEALTTL